MLQAGEVVGGLYQIVQKIGSGGTGDVYLAYHLRLNKYVVVKKIKDNFVGKINIRAEVDILKRLKHTYLPLVYDFVQRGTQIFTVMDYIEGYDLEAYIKAGHRFDEETILKWLKQLCEVLHYLHSQNPPIIHSDVKPGNIMITADGNVCLIDFNISLDGDDSSQISGISMPYAAPEQYDKAVLYSRGQEHRHIVLDGRCDMYSLGATFYQLMSGVAPARPFETGTPLYYMNSGYSEGLVSVIDKSMNINIEDRYDNMSKMISDINSIHKKSKQYKIYTLGILGSSLTYLLAVCLGIWCIIHGFTLNINNEFEKLNTMLVEQYENGEYENSIDTGISILNDDDFDSILSNNKMDAAIIYHTIGEGYFNYDNPNYEEAVLYYERAIELIEDSDDSEMKANYYRDYIVALVRAGQITDADDERIHMAKEQVGGHIIDIVQVGISYNNGEYSEAMDQIDGLLADSNISNEEKMHLLVLGSDAADEEKKYIKNIDYLNEALKLDDSISVIRKLAKAYADAGGSVKKSYYKEAQKYYVILTESKYVSMNDWIGLAVCYRANDNHEKAINTLEAIKSEYEDYSIYMELVFAYEGISDNKVSYEDKEKKILKYGDKCLDEIKKLSSENQQIIKRSNDFLHLQEILSKYE